MPWAFQRTRSTRSLRGRKRWGGRRGGRLVVRERTTRPDGDPCDVVLFTAHYRQAGAQGPTRAAAPFPHSLGRGREATRGGLAGRRGASRTACADSRCPALSLSLSLSLALSPFRPLPLALSPSRPLPLALARRERGGARPARSRHQSLACRSPMAPSAARRADIGRGVGPLSAMMARTKAVRGAGGPAVQASSG